MYVYTCILSADWRVLENHFNSLCNALSHNYQLTINKLKTIPEFIKDGEQLNKLISSPDDVMKINKKIITYLIIKLCYNSKSTNSVTLCDVMDKLIDSTDTPTCLQQIRFGECPSCLSVVIGLGKFIVHKTHLYVCNYIHTYVCMIRHDWL